MWVAPGLSIRTGDFEMQVEKVAQFDPPMLFEQLAQLILCLADKVAVEEKRHGFHLDQGFYPLGPFGVFPQFQS